MKSCYVCDVDLIPEDAENWRANSALDKCCAKCAALIQGQRPSDADKKRSKGCVVSRKLLNERREKYIEETNKRAKVAAGGKKKKVEPPQEPGEVDVGKTKGPSVPATVVLCSDCGEPNHIPVKTTHNKIIAKCSKCGARISLENVVMGKMRVPRGAIKAAEQLGLKPGVAAPKGKGTHAGDKDEPQFMTMSFRVTHEQRDIIRLAMECGRRQCDDAQARAWHGRVLELICGDYVAGVPGHIIDQVREELKEGEE